MVRHETSTPSHEVPDIIPAIVSIKMMLSDVTTIDKDAVREKSERSEH
jgi:hypothetical protein